MTPVQHVPPTVVVDPSSISITGTLTSGSTSVTGISSTAGLYPGMTVLGSGPTPNAIASIVSGTAITLFQAATVSGSIALSVQGKQPLATVTMAGDSVSGITMFVPGSGYTVGANPNVTIYPAPNAGGSGATATCTVSRTIAFIPVTSPGSDYTSQPTITVSDADGTGCTAVAIMSGAAPSDVLTWSASASWLTASVGPAPVTSGGVGGQLFGTA